MKYYSLTIFGTFFALIADSESVNIETEKDFYHALANKAVEQLNSENDDMHHWKLEKLISVKKQLVAGYKYNLKFLVARSECRKEGDDVKVSLNLCSVRDDSPKEICHYDIIVKEWENTEEILSHGCHRHKKSHHHAHHLRHEGDGLAFKSSSNVLKVAKTIKPKDMAIWNLFSGFIDRHTKVYETKREVLKRFRIYKHNVRAAKMWQDNEQGTAVYGETPYMDMTPEEFRSIYLPYKWQKPAFPVRQLSDWDFEVNEEAGEKIPPSFDWRKEGIVTSVKNQESCGSCWAFSVTGNIEGQWARKTGKLESLSEQELLDCDVIDKACSGGLPLNAYKEIIRLGGLIREEDYPYDARKETCHLLRPKITAYINDSIQLPNDEGKMAIWLFKNGPISIGVNASPLQFYRHGISHPWKIFCNPLLGLTVSSSVNDERS